MGKPLSPEEFEAIMRKQTQEKHVITYGEQKVKDRARLNIEVKEEKGRSTCGCCGGCAACCGDDRDTKGAYVQQYE